MESSLLPAPLPRSYDDSTVWLLEPLHDSFFARELEQRRFSKKQEGEWAERIAKDVQRSERAVRTCRIIVPLLDRDAHNPSSKTNVVKRWLTAVSLSNRREFCKPLTDEAFQLFVRFFWLIKAGDRPKANQLLAHTRQKWGLEPQFHAYAANELLEFGDDSAFAYTTVSYWICHPRGQASGFGGKAVSTTLFCKVSGDRARQLTSHF